MLRKKFNVLVENSTGQFGYKFEYDTRYKRLKLDRILSGRNKHFCNYGFIVNTYASSATHLDAVILTGNHLWSIPVNTIVECRAVGVFNMWDEEGYDPKILCVPCCSQDSDFIQDVQDIPRYIKTGLEDYFCNYKSGSKHADSVVVKPCSGIEEADKLIEEYWIDDVDLNLF